jgi:ubiquinone/menaquinone biosynthesis C-methylase UbiE
MLDGREKARALRYVKRRFPEFWEDSERHWHQRRRPIPGSGFRRGFFFIAASQAVGKDGVVYVFDVNEDSISKLEREIAETKLANIEASVVDITKKLPVADENIGLAFMSNVLHGLVANNEMDSTFKEIARVATHNGRLAVVEFKKQKSPHGPPLSIRLSPEEVEALASRYSFLRESVKEAGPYIMSLFSGKREFFHQLQAFHPIASVKNARE